MARAYAWRVLLLRMVAVRNSMKHLPAFSPAWAMTAGRMGPFAVPNAPAWGILTESLLTVPMLPWRSPNWEG